MHGRQKHCKICPCVSLKNRTVSFAVTQKVTYVFGSREQNPALFINSDKALSVFLNGPKNAHSEGGRWAL